jgi:hypothetical protein
VNVDAGLKGVFEHLIVGFPNYDLQVRPVEVRVSDGEAGIRDEELPDVGQGMVGG